MIPQERKREKIGRKREREDKRTKNPKKYKREQKNIDEFYPLMWGKKKLTKEKGARERERERDKGDKHRLTLWSFL